ncbi:hypothetical protein [Streptomyces sp. WAC05858]|uniref:hypothetical protein n=1 Tax=Streptomyces TaxID=1883 RepID=UPI000F78E70C|nr:hypothetical protein [Streptomyces sp. WAC05858]RSS34687.1 hypothetical protein EF902_40025 [Streptomyces sp. WAC05858]
MSTVYRNNRRDMKAIQSVPKGTTLYVIEEIDTRGARRYEDAKLCARYTVTSTHLLGGAMCGSMSVEQLLTEHGTVYTEQPSGVRGYWEPSPQVAGPLGDEEPFDRPLDKTEIRGLRKRTWDNRAEQKKANRRGWL